MDRLIRYNDRWYVEHVDTYYSQPTASCMWWPVARFERRDPTVEIESGAVLRALPSHNPGGEYAGDGFAVHLTDGGATLPEKAWLAEIPPPKGCKVLASDGTRYPIEPGDAVYREGAWHKALKTKVKVYPLPKRLRWQEAPGDRMIGRQAG